MCWWSIDYSNRFSVIITGLPRRTYQPNQILKSCVFAVECIVIEFKWSIYLPEPSQSFPLRISEKPFGILANSAFLFNDNNYSELLVLFTTLRVLLCIMYIKWTYKIQSRLTFLRSSASVGMGSLLCGATAATAVLFTNWGLHIVMGSVFIQVFIIFCCVFCTALSRGVKAFLSRSYLPGRTLRKQWELAGFFAFSCIAR